MRFFLGRDIIGNQKIFSVTVTATNCTYTGDTTIAIGGTASLLFTASSGYELPSAVTVTGATSSWDSSTGVLILSAVTGAVTVTVEATEVIIVSTPIYGVSGLYQSSPTLTRTDDAVNMSAVVNSSTGLVSSDFDNAFPWNEATVETINGNKFLHMPDMWFRVGKDSSDRITDVAVSKAQGDSGSWYKVDSFYYGCYGGSVANNKLASVSGAERLSYRTRAEFRYFVSNTGIGYHQLDLYHHTVMLFLWWIEWANKNSQNIMRGVDTGTARNTGGTDSLTTPSGFNTSTRQMRWHYIEDYIGNYFEFVEGSVGSGSTYYVTADPSKFNDTGLGMNTLGYGYPSNASESNRCISAYGWDSNNPFLCEPKEQTGTDYTVHFCDANPASNNSVLFCGASREASVDGFGVSYCSRRTTSYNDKSSGARLLYKPAS